MCVCARKEIIFNINLTIVTNRFVLIEDQSCEIVVHFLSCIVWHSSYSFSCAPSITYRRHRTNTYTCPKSLECIFPGKFSLENVVKLLKYLLVQCFITHCDCVCAIDILKIIAYFCHPNYTQTRLPYVSMVIKYTFSRWKGKNTSKPKIIWENKNSDCSRIYDRKRLLPWYEMNVALNYFCNGISSIGEQQHQHRHRHQKLYVCAQCASVFVCSVVHSLVIITQEQIVSTRKDQVFYFQV